MNFLKVDALKKSAVKHLLQHYLGAFFQDRITLDQLSVNLSDGVGTLRDVQLDVQTINEKLLEHSIPLELIDGFVESVEANIPWKALNVDNSEFSIKGLELCVRPKQREEDCLSGFDSMFASMTSSLQLAEECSKAAQSDGSDQQFEGVEIVAQMIDTVLSKIRATLHDTVVRLEHANTSDPNMAIGAAVEIRIKRVEYFDESCSEMSVTKSAPLNCTDEKPHIYEPAAIASKIFKSSNATPILETPLSSGLTTEQPNSHDFARSIPRIAQNDGLPTRGQPEKVPRSEVLAMKVTGKQELRLRVKQKASVSGPKLDVSLDCTCAHILLCPRQVALLYEIFNNGLMACVSGDGMTKPPAATNHRPMTELDYARIGGLLPQNRARPAAVSRPHHAQRSHGVAAHSPDAGNFQSIDLNDDSDTEYGGSVSSVQQSDIFLSMHRGGRSKGSGGGGASVSGASLLSSSSGRSSSALKPGKAVRVTPSSQPPAAAGSTTTVFRYKLNFGLITVVLLHSDIEAYLGDQIDEPVSSMQLQAKLAMTYFDSVAPAFSHQSLSLADFASEISKHCGRDHISFVLDFLLLQIVPVTARDFPFCCLLSLISKPVTLDMMERRAADGGRLERTWTMDASAGVARLCEVLVQRRTQLAKIYDTEIFPLVEFMQSSSDTSAPQSQAVPCIRLRVTGGSSLPLDNQTASANAFEHQSARSSHFSDHTLKEHGRSDAERIEVAVELQPFSMELDISIADRLSPLLNFSSFDVSHLANMMRTTFVDARSTFAASNCFASFSAPAAAPPSLFIVRLGISFIGCMQRRSGLAMASYSGSVAVQNTARRWMQPSLRGSLDPTSSSPLSSPSCDDIRANIHITARAEQANVRLRFPIPDLRDGTDKFSWRRRNLRGDILHLNVKNLSLTAASHPSPVLSRGDRVGELGFVRLACESCYGSFQEDESNELVPFLRVDKVDNGGNEADDEPSGLGSLNSVPSFSEKASHPSFTVRFFDRALSPQSILEEDIIETNGDGASKLLRLAQSRKGNSPFSSRRVMHEGSELMMPGDQAEMMAFSDSCSKFCKLSMYFNFPRVLLDVPDKRFLELVYNRFFNDLAMWESLLPKTNFDSLLASPRHKTVSATTDEDDALIPQDSKGKRKKKRSEGARGHSEFKSLGHGLARRVSDTTESEPDDDAEAKQQHEVVVKVSIGAARAILHHYPASSDSPEGASETCSAAAASPRKGCKQHKQERVLEFILDVQNASVFSVSGFGGDLYLSYVSSRVHQVNLSYRDLADSTQFHPTAAAGIGVRPQADGGNSSLSAPSEAIVLIHSAETFKPNGPIEQIAVAVKVQAQAHRAHRESLVAAAVSDTTYRSVLFIRCCMTNRRQALHLSTFSNLRYRQELPDDSWLLHFIDLFTLIDIEILGQKERPSVSQLYCHVWNSFFDYLPQPAEPSAGSYIAQFRKNESLKSLHMLPSALVKIGSFTLCSNIVPTANSSLLKFMFENVKLYLSSPRSEKRCSLACGTCVADLDLLELSVRITDQNEKERHTESRLKVPDFEMKASGSKLTLSTCSDSCAALLRLIVHLASFGDLADVPSKSAAESRSDTTTAHSSAANDEQGIDIDLLGDALVEDVPVRNERRRKQKRSNVTSGFLGEEPRALRQTVDDAFIVLESGVPTRTEHQLNELLSDEVADEPLDIVDNHFAPEVLSSDWTKQQPPATNYKTRPQESANSNRPKSVLDAPKDFPVPLTRFTVLEFSVEWQIFGGRDFEASCHWPPSRSCSECRNPRATRDKDTMLSALLHKIGIAVETCPPSSEYASRRVACVETIEVRDRVKASDFNMMLYQHETKERPRPENSKMILMKILSIRPELSAGVLAEESVFKLSMLPLRFNVDQDALIFARIFCAEVDALCSAVPFSTRERRDSCSTHQQPIFGSPPKEHDVMMHSRLQDAVADSDEDGVGLGGSRPETPVPKFDHDVRTSVPYIRHFIFAADVPITLDYRGKRLDMEQGTLSALLAYLAQLNCTELILKKIDCRQGVLGYDQLLKHLVREWTNDIQKNQLGSVIGSVGPLRPLFRFSQGVCDLFWFPVAAYGSPNGRVLSELRRGAHSFGTSTGVAVLELSSRIVHTIQCCAEVAYDVVSPQPRLIGQRRVLQVRAGHAGTGVVPVTDLREGVAAASDIIQKGVIDTASNIASAAVGEHERKGISGAVGGVLREIPPAMVQPIVLMSQATMSVLAGMRYQFQPDAKTEDEHRWKQA